VASYDRGCRCESCKSSKSQKNRLYHLQRRSR
jgi:hypothetical protein